MLRGFNLEKSRLTSLELDDAYARDHLSDSVWVDLIDQEESERAPVQD
ncbi:hypothetical protein LW982_18000 [Erwinia amylovora]|nr:hypothetical protein [Erwinia amylovora]MCK8215279.1 hypothetical protein [Erwinia amylovora]